MAWLGDEWGLDERSRKPARPSIRKRSTHLSTVLGVVWNRRAAAAFDRAPWITLRAIASRPFAGSATPARRSPPRSAFRRQLSAPSLKRRGLNRLSALEPAEPVRRYERATPGEIIHIDIKKLGKFSRIGRRVTGDRTGQSNTRGVGWEYVHLAIDDHSRLAYSEILPNEKRSSCLRFLFNALRFFRGFGVRVERVMTDNGSSFRSRRYAKALRLLKIKHLRTKPYTPKTNGRAERFVQTSLARAGLRQGLRQLRGTRRRTAHLAAPQLASPSWQYRRPAANQHTRANRGQRVEAPQLERRSSQLPAPSKSKPQQWVGPHH